MPRSGLLAVTTCRGNDLQWETPPPVENGIGNQVDTVHKHLVDTEEGQSKELVKPNVMTKNLKVKERIQVLGYVPVQIANLLLEETELKKHLGIWKFSPV